MGEDDIKGLDCDGSCSSGGRDGAAVGAKKIPGRVEGGGSPLMGKIEKEVRALPLTGLLVVLW
jgi:hypothetical protein